jgi:hypothetical protein
MLASGTSIRPLALLLVLCVGTGAWDAMRSPANPAQATFAIAATEIARSRDEFSGVSLSKVAPGTQERLAAQEDGGAVFPRICKTPRLRSATSATTLAWLMAISLPR